MQFGFGGEAMTPQEALRQCVEAMRLVDFKDCAESPELWQKLNAAQQVAEEVLKRPAQDPVAWAVTFDGEVTGNIFNRKDNAKRTMMNLNSSHPSFERAILPLYFSPVAAQQTRTTYGDEIVAALDALQVGCTETSWIGWQNGDGEEVGTRLQAAIDAYKGQQAEPAPTGDAEQDARLLDQVARWRKEVARLNDLIAAATGQQPAAAPSGDVERECTHEMLCAAIKAAVQHKIIAAHADEETYLKNWAGMKEVIRAAITATKE